MNTFLALRLADRPRDMLSALSERLQAWNLPAAWTHPEDYHLTLLFLGRLDADEARSLPSAVEIVADGVRRPRLAFSGLGATGGRTEPRVVYAALRDEEDACAGIHHDLAGALALEPEKRFMPHVSLCRPRPAHQRADAELPGNRDWPQLLEAHGLAEWGPCEVTHLVLYRTEPERRPRYRQLAAWPLV